MGNASGKPDMMEIKINMKMSHSQFTRLSKKADKDKEAKKKKCRDAIAKGDAETARIYAENAVSGFFLFCFSIT